MHRSLLLSPSLSSLRTQICNTHIMVCLYNNNNNSICWDWKRDGFGVMYICVNSCVFHSCLVMLNWLWWMLHLIRNWDLLCVQYGRFRFWVGGWVVQRTSVTSVWWLSVTVFRIRKPDLIRHTVPPKSQIFPSWTVTLRSMEMNTNFISEPHTHTTWDFDICMVSDVEAIHRDLFRSDFFSFS